MRYPFGRNVGSEFQRLERERLERERLERLMQLDEVLFGQAPLQPAVLRAPWEVGIGPATLTPGGDNRRIESHSSAANTSPFRRDNRRPDGTWEAPDATEDNIKGTSVDPYDPVWPRWKQTLPADEEGDFVSDQPFFDINEITQTAEFYPPGRPLRDVNLDGNPATRQRVRDSLTGNLWRRRLLVGRAPEVHSSSGNLRMPIAEGQQAGETRVIEGPLFAPGPIAPPQPDPPDDPQFTVTRIPGTNRAIFVPRFTFRVVDPETGRVVGELWREGEAFEDFDENENMKPDSMEPGNVGGHNPRGRWMLLERPW